MVKRQREGKGDSSFLVGFFFSPRDLAVSCPPYIVCFTLETFEVICFPVIFFLPYPSSAQEQEEHSNLYILEKYFFLLL